MNFKQRVLALPINRIIALMIMDIAVIYISGFMALFFRFDFSINAITPIFLEGFSFLMKIMIPLTIFLFYLCHLYKSVWRYASATEFLNVALATSLSTAAQYFLALGFGRRMPRSYYLFYWFILGVCVCGIRFSYRILRILRNRRIQKMNPEKISNVMIIGAGAEGNNIIKEIESSSIIAKSVKCIIDDNPGCHGKLLRGKPIVGGRDRILSAVAEYDIDEIIYAMPSSNLTVRKEILKICSEAGCKMLALPGMYQLINEDVTVAKLKQVEIEDLLGREPVTTNISEISDYIEDKAVLVTGGGGSIGSEICRQVAANGCKRLIIVDIYENNAYEIQQELIRKYPKLDLVVLIASVRNELRMNRIFEQYRPDVVYHAAAHKHVPLMEDSPREAIKNNCMGTLKTAQAADRYHVKKFVLISTDKAVNPTNVMGASKRICEMIVQTMNNHSDTNFVAVRFGNVLGSNGSVIPLFKKQIAEGGPVTVTDPNIIRYFMTIPEATSLVLQAGAFAKGGEIFVLDMGEPVKIVDLATNLIKLSGYRPNEDIEIKFTGLRPGEKMYEELLMNEEGLRQTNNKMIFIGKPIEFDEENFMEHLQELAKVADSEDGDIRAKIKEIVTTYHYA